MSDTFVGSDLTGFAARAPEADLPTAVSKPRSYQRLEGGDRHHVLDGAGEIGVERDKRFGL
jgi:hypothetical protein